MSDLIHQLLEKHGRLHLPVSASPRRTDIGVTGTEILLVDKLEDHSGIWFRRNFDPESARRQLRVSVLLVLAMSLAAFVLGFALPIDAPHAIKSAAADSDEFTGRLVTIDR